MKKHVGIWLDHRRAHLIYLLKHPGPGAEEKDMIETINSGVERRVRLSGGARSAKTPYGPQDIAVDGKQEARIKRQLGRYYKEIAGRVDDADRFVIFGPGEAKMELKKVIEKTGQLAKKLSAVEPADKMSLKQIAAKVRSYFSVDQ